MPLKVFVVMTSAPACEVLVVDLADHLRLGEVQHLVRASQVAWVIREPLAAEVSLAQAAAPG